MHVGQAQDLGHIQLHRVLGDAQLTGDLVVGLALADQARDVQLTGRELVEQGRDLGLVRMTVSVGGGVVRGLH